MRNLLFVFVVLTGMICFTQQVQAENVFSLQVDKHVQTALVNNQLTAVDNFGTPLVIKLARQGNIQQLQQLAQQAHNGDFLNARDKYNNNLFHVAKNAPTVQAIASLIRTYHGANAIQQIETMVNQRNVLDETPLFAQINAGHSDTFRLLYTPSALKQKNDAAKNHLARLQGSDPTIMERNKIIYCQEIRQLASANGFTLLQAAQGQIPYNPKMAPLAQEIAQTIPCLAQD